MGVQFLVHQRRAFNHSEQTLKQTRAIRGARHRQVIFQDHSENLQTTNICESNHSNSSPYCNQKRQ